MNNKADSQKQQPESAGQSDTRQVTQPAGLAGKAHEAAEQARSIATERVQSARQRADSAKADAAERVRRVGTAFRKVGEHLRVEEQTYLAERAAGTGQRLENAADYIANAQLKDMMRDAEDLARRKPVWVFGGTFLIGLAAGRLFKGTGPAVTQAGAGR